MNRPGVVHVGHLDFSVRFLDNDEWPDEYSANSGLMSGYEALISIRIQGPTQDENVVRETLLHEIMHAIWYVSGLFYDNPREFIDIEETTILRTAPVLLQVFRDNPDLVKYLTP